MDGDNVLNWNKEFAQFLKRELANRTLPQSDLSKMEYSFICLNK